MNKPLQTWFRIGFSNQCPVAHSFLLISDSTGIRVVLFFFYYYVFFQLTNHMIAFLDSIWLIFSKQLSQPNHASALILSTGSFILRNLTEFFLLGRANKCLQSHKLTPWPKWISIIGSRLHHPDTLTTVGKIEQSFRKESSFRGMKYCCKPGLLGKSIIYPRAG